MDAECYAALQFLIRKRRLEQTPGLECVPALVSQAVRDAIRDLRGVAVSPRPHRKTLDIEVAFLGDQETRRVINEQVMRSNSPSVSACIRDLIVYAATAADRRMMAWAACLSPWTATRKLASGWHVMPDNDVSARVTA